VPSEEIGTKLNLLHIRC